MRRLLFTSFTMSVFAPILSVAYYNMGFIKSNKELSASWTPRWSNMKGHFVDDAFRVIWNELFRP